MRGIRVVRAHVFGMVAVVFLAATGLVTVQQRIALNVLYAGNPSSSRTTDFVDFLTFHFERVETIDLAKLTEKDAQRFDVVLLDHDTERHPRPKFSDTYGVPTVTIGDAGAHIGNTNGLKTGYL